MAISNLNVTCHIFILYKYVINNIFICNMYIYRFAYYLIFFNDAMLYASVFTLLFLLSYWFEIYPRLYVQLYFQYFILFYF